MLVWEAVEWDELNETHATRHGVSATEIEEILMSADTFRPDRRGSGDYLAEGVTAGGRRVRVVVVHDPVRRVFRPIAAWELR